LERVIAEEHMQLCLHSSLNLSGINAEVAPGQWEFQIGPSEGIRAADELILARYLLERVATEHGATISYEPKPNPHLNGSGCHVNFSTVQTRQEGGFETIEQVYMPRLEQGHPEYIQVTGDGNEARLTGHHETSSHTRFTWGVGTRNTSVRVGNRTAKDKKGYFEDRRPAANMDPYAVTSLLLKQCADL
jgi:glutamine synthetase